MKASTDSASECGAREAWFEAHHPRDGDSQPHGGQQPFSCPEEQKGGGRKPGQPVAEARFWKFPPRPFTLENRRYRWHSRNHFGPARNSHVSLDTTLRHFVASRNTKNGRHCEEAVDEETSLWKAEEIADAILNGCYLFQMLSMTYTSFKSNPEMHRRCGKKVEISPSSVLPAVRS